MDPFSAFLCSAISLTCCIPPDTTVMTECTKRTKPIVIAVIDTGFGQGWPGEKTAHLCKFGHKNFVEEAYTSDFNTKDPIPVDAHGHGTHIAGTIDYYAKQSRNPFCLVILKYYSPKQNESQNLENTVRAIKWATELRVDFINYSGGGLAPAKSEQDAVKEFIDRGGTFVAAAGNEHSDLAKRHYYPAQEDDRIIVVGNGINEDVHAETSNHGTRVNMWEKGQNVVTYGQSMTGTSQAAAKATGKLVASKYFCK